MFTRKKRFGVTQNLKISTSKLRLRTGGGDLNNFSAGRFWLASMATA